MGQTLYDKLWNEHVVHTEDDGTAILYIDRHLVHEVTSPQAFEGLREAGRKVWRISSVVATADHNTPTTGWERGYDGIDDPVSKEQVTTLDRNIAEFGAAAYFPFLSKRQGIVQRAIGIPVSLFTAIFALARTVGWIAQLNEMIGDPEYKIGRPRQLFTGSPRREVKPIAQR